LIPACCRGQQIFCLQQLKWIGIEQQSKRVIALKSMQHWFYWMIMSPGITPMAASPIKALLLR
jgi:hypothetical protein